VPLTEQQIAEALDTAHEVLELASHGVRLPWSSAEYVGSPKCPEVDRFQDSTGFVMFDIVTPNIARYVLASANSGPALADAIVTMAAEIAQLRSDIAVLQNYVDTNRV